MTKLFVGSLSFDVTSADLHAAFSAYGTVSATKVVTDSSSGGSRGFGFVEMARASEATAAIAALEGAVLHGRKIHVSRARAGGNEGKRGNPPQGWAVVGAGRHRW